MARLFSRNSSQERFSVVDVDDQIGGEREIKIKNERSVLDYLLKARIEISNSCGGMGTCGTCRVEVVDAPALLEERNEIENQIARDRGLRPNERLSCQMTAVTA